MESLTAKCMYFLAAVCVINMIALMVGSEIWTVGPTSVALPPMHRLSRCGDPIKPPARHLVDDTTDDVELRLKHTEEMKQRVRHLREACQQEYGVNTAYNTKQARAVPHLFISNRHDLMICLVQKAASSNALRLLLLLEQIVVNKSSKNITVPEVLNLHIYLRNGNLYSDNQLKCRLIEYKKAIIVREPFERLIAAYNDKFLLGNAPYFMKLTDTILKRIHGNITTTKKRRLTFAEFIQFVILQYDSGERPDQHWATITEKCSPCAVKYDYIAKFETVDDDVDFLLRQINADSSITWPRRNDVPQHKELQKASVYLRDYYKDILPAHIETLRRIYARDSLLFGYDFPGALAELLYGH